MVHVVVVDNQEIPLDAETAASDHEIRQALRWCYPEIANATINRRTEGEREIITVIKRAGTKGTAAGDVIEKAEFNALRSARRTLEDVCSELRRAPEDINPAVECAYTLQARIASGALTLTDLILLEDEMQGAIEAGESEERRVEQARTRLVRASAVAAPSVPTGF